MSLYNKVQELAAKEEWLASVAMIDQILADSKQMETSQRAFYYYQQGYFYNKANKHHAAILALSRALVLYEELDDLQNSVLTLVFKAKLCLSLQETEKAIFYLTCAYSLLDRIPANLKIYVCENLALAWEKIACFAKALYHWHECLTFDNTTPSRFREQEQRIKQKLFL